MCGILGGYAPQVAPEEWKSALVQLQHRGPDDSGLVFPSAGFAMGNTRLAIQDLSEAGQQPMASEDGRWTLVYNGELWNAGLLRTELRSIGQTFRGSCDTEVLLKAWQCWGNAALSRIEGIFSFAIFDGYRQCITLVRDAIGVKPCYYYHDENSFAFASELKALLSIPQFHRKILPERFLNYLLLQWSPAEALPMEHCFKLMPGEMISVTVESNKAEVAKRRWYALPGGRVRASAPHAVAEGTALLTEVLSSQLSGNVPIGFFLSGGIDSSLLAALGADRKLLPQINAFTIDHSGSGKAEGFAEDALYAKLVAKRYGMRHHLIPGPIDWLRQLDKLVWQLDEPQGDLAPLYVRSIAEAARSMGIKVLISGAGGDDVFSGYRRHQALSMLRLARLSRGLAPLSRAFLSSKGTMARRLQKLWNGAGLSIFEQQVSLFFWQPPAVVLQLFHPDLRKQLHDCAPYNIFKQAAEEATGESDRLNRFLNMELRTFLPHHNLNYTDKMGMAAGVEIRTPYTDPRMIAWAATLPRSWKMHGSETKVALRKMAEPLLPGAILKRSKAGFGAPLREWMTQPRVMEPIRARLLEGSLRASGYFDLRSIEQLWERSTRQKEDAAYTILTLLSIESWIRQFSKASA